MGLHLQQRQDLIRSRRERRKLAKSARIRRQFVRYLCLFALLILASSSFFYLPWALLDVDRDVVVEGNQVVTVDQVRSSLSSFVGKPIYALNPKLLAQRVQSLEAVRYTFVRRYLFPHPHLVVTVLEQFPWATFATSPDSEPKAVISETGRMIPIQEFPTIIQPELKIYGPANLTMTSHSVSQWAAWCSFIAAQTGQKVNYIDMRQWQNIGVQDGDLYLKLGAPDSSLTRRLGRLASVMPTISKIAGQIQYIDLRLDNNVPIKAIL